MGGGGWVAVMGGGEQLHVRADLYRIADDDPAHVEEDRAPVDARPGPTVIW
jgi:hypothetical protein